MWRRLVLLSLALIFMSSVLPLHQAKGTTAALKVDPPGVSGLNPGDIFSINITVSDVTDLFAWQFRLFYQSAVLNGTDIAEGPFLAQGGVTPFFIITNFTDNYNATHGFMWVSSTRKADEGGVNGTGTLATISFKTVGGGNSILHLFDTKLIDSVKPFGNLIPHEVFGGWAYVGLVNIAITDLKTPINIPNGTMAYINVTTQNKGQFTANFDVTLYDDYDPIETKSVIDLPGGGTQILNFTWDTTPIPVGEYTLNATATLVPGESDTSDNTFSVKVHVGIRDVAVTSITPNRTSIPPGIPAIDLNVTVRNKGVVPETLNVTLYFGSNIIGTQIASLVSGGDTTLTFTWNITTLPYPNCTVLAYALPVPYEMQIADNNFTKAISTIQGDINGDITVDIYDAILLSGAYNTVPGDPNWNANADLNSDNGVDIYDAILLANHYGE